MNRQRYIAVLADESGTVLTSRQLVVKLVKSQLSGVPTGKQRAMDDSEYRGEYNRLLSKFGYDPVTMAAVLKVESGSKAFLKNRIIARFEPHQFLYRTTKERSPDGKNNRANRAKYGRTVILPGMPLPPGAVVLKKTKLGNRIVEGADIPSIDGRQRFSGMKTNFEYRQSIEYDAIALASTINAEYAYLSSSWGLGQIMGFNHKVVGFSDPFAMVEDFTLSAWNQKSAVIRFFRNYTPRDEVTGKTVDEAVRTRDWDSFARVYNGDKKGIYAKRIKDAIKGV